MRVACFTIRAVAEHSGTKERRNINIVVFVRQTKTKSRVDDGEIGVTTVNGIAGEPRAIAKILARRSTITAFAAGPGEPGDADALANGKSLDAFADLFEAADDLVAGNERQFRIRQFTIDHMKVGATNRACFNADEQL